MADFFARAHNITNITIYSEKLIPANIFSCFSNRLEQLQCHHKNSDQIYDTNEGSAVTDALLALNIKSLILGVKIYFCSQWNRNCTNQPKIVNQNYGENFKHKEFFSEGSWENLKIKVLAKLNGSHKKD